MNPVVRRLLGCGTIAALVVLMAMLVLPGIGSRPMSTRSQCMSQLRNVGFALMTYAVNHENRLPPAYLADENGEPMQSWRVQSLPYIELQAAFNKYRPDEPWNGPHNSQLGEFTPLVYHCPAEYPDSAETQPWTSYVAVVGPQTLWPGAEAGNLDDIPDGAANTLLLAEVRISGIHWMEPRDLLVDQMNPRINADGPLGISSVHSGVANVMFADGHITSISEKISPAVLGQLIQRDDGGPADADLP